MNPRQEIIAFRRMELEALAEVLNRHLEQHGNANTSNRFAVEMVLEKVCAALDSTKGEN